MICLAYAAQSHVYAVTIIFYTCIWIPFLQIKRAVLRIVGFMFCPLAVDDQISSNCCCSQMGLLPAARFEDLDYFSNSSSYINTINDELEILECSVCLVELEREDVVSQLPRCGHVFHMGCIERWLHRNHFTCPLCRSLFLHAHASPSCKMIIDAPYPFIS